MRKPRCEDCAFFVANPDDDTSGLCRFNPQPIIVRDDAWCGRWRNVFLEKFALWDHPVGNEISDP